VLKHFKTQQSFAGNRARLNFNLKDYSTKAEVLAAVDRINYLGRNTNTTGGLKVARLEVFDKAGEERPNVDQIIVLITDGAPTYDADKLDDEVAAVKADGIRIIGLGVTNMVSPTLFCVVQITYYLTQSMPIYTVLLMKKVCELRNLSCILQSVSNSTAFQCIL